jgi:hypothetical protein
MHTLIRHTIIVFAVAFLAFAPLSTVPAGLSTAFAQEAGVAASTGDTQAAAGAAPSSCYWYNWFMDWPRCVFRPGLNWIGSWFLTLGAAFLLLAGTAFDYFLNNLVINFGQTITSMNILPGIQQGWQLFRDVANIAIIGVFVFVAIMTILGSAEYGAKRLVARVLIVAILINFSLLFSRIIVESTNFVSGQFARAMPGYTKEKGPATAESFLLAFGIEDWWNTSSITSNAAEKSDSTTMGLFYGAVGGIALFGVGVVLLYGAFVMVARALLLIFMMLTSAIAFASFLIPKWANQNFIGWSSWWSNLLKAAMFGPLLMIFLWVAMTIVQQAASVAKVGEGIRAVAENPATASANAWTGIILLLIGTGLLFIAIRSASSFASSIGGFNWAAVAPAFATGVLGRITGLAGQTLLGGGSYLAAQRLQALSQNKDQPMAMRKAADFGALQLMKAASQNYNTAAMLSKQSQGTAGLKAADALFGKAMKGFAGGQDRKVDRAAKQAERMHMDEKDQEKVYGAAMAKAMKENRGLEAEHKDSGAAAEVAKQIAEKISSQQEKTVQTFQQEMKTLQTKMTEASINNDHTAIERMKEYKERREAEHEADMHTQTERINTARKNALDAEGRHKEVVGKIEKVAGVQKEIETKADLGQKLVRSSFSSVLQKAAGIESMAKAQEKAVVKKIGEERESKRIRAALVPPTSEKPSAARAPEFKPIAPPSDMKDVA